MKYTAVVLLAAASGCFVAAPPMRFGGKSSQEAQHQTLTNYTPPALVSNDTWTGKVTTARIRVYADDDFRAQNVHWERTFDDELAYANEVLTPLLGIHVEAEYRVWSHHAPAASLAESLEELMRLDPGTNVLSVVGLTSALGLVSGTFDQLGYASIGGRHAVLRGYADAQERQMFERAFPDLRASEREALFDARRRHKTTAVLLHELGHNLGVSHEDDPATLMNATYSDHSASFSAHARDVMRATVDDRLRRATSVTAQVQAHPRVVIRIDHELHAIFGGQPIDDATLGELLKMSYEDDHDTEVLVRAPKDVPHSAVVRVLDLVKAAGLQKVSLGID